jgi:hypothetical protein
MEIDARRFPQFARLAKTSTFYRNATTVHPRTFVAVPAILSGRFPERDLPPLAAHYPFNLFQTIRSTGQFEMAVFEPATRLDSPRHKSGQTALQKTEGLIRTLSTIYLRLILTEDLPGVPDTPPEWSPLEKAEEQVELTPDSESLIHYAGVDERPQQLAHFLNCIKSSVRPRFTFLHVELPHVPWVFLPTGEQYVHETSFDHPAGGFGVFSEDWLGDPATIERDEFRYRLQVGLVDRFVGRLLDRLVETNVLDKCLLIVTADHGVSFRSGHSRRLPDADTLADIASVPLFIKLPGQKAERVDDRNVETIDIFPTIAETLEMELSQAVDGIPVSQARRRPQKTMYNAGRKTVIEPDLPQRREAVLRQFELFGHDDLDHLPASISTHPEWQGRKIASFVVEGQPVPARLIDPLRERTNPSPYSWMKGVATSRRFLKGTFQGSELPETPADLVVTVDGLIRDSESTFRSYGNVQGFEFLLPKSVSQNDTNSVRLYLVNRSQNPPSLRPVSITSENPF